MQPTYIVCVSIVGASFKIFSVNQSLNSFLHNTRIWVEKRQLRQHLRKQLLMLQGLSGLHNADNGGLNSNGSILLDSLRVER